MEPAQTPQGSEASTRGLKHVLFQKITLPQWLQTIIHVVVVTFLIVFTSWVLDRIRKLEAATEGLTKQVEEMAKKLKQ